MFMGSRLNLVHIIYKEKSRETLTITAMATANEPTPQKKLFSMT